MWLVSCFSSLTIKKRILGCYGRGGLCWVRTHKLGKVKGIKGCKKDGRVDLSFGTMLPHLDLIPT